jgi:hypothetical protein
VWTEPHGTFEVFWYENTSSATNKTAFRKNTSVSAKKFSAVYGSRRFIAMLTHTRHVRAMYCHVTQ